MKFMEKYTFLIALAYCGLRLLFCLWHRHKRLVMR